MGLRLGRAGSGGLCLRQHRSVALFRESGWAVMHSTAGGSPGPVSAWHIPSSTHGNQLTSSEGRRRATGWGGCPEVLDVSGIPPLLSSAFVVLHAPRAARRALTALGCSPASRLPTQARPCLAQWLPGLDPGSQEAVVAPVRLWVQGSCSWRGKRGFALGKRPSADPLGQAHVGSISPSCWRVLRG